MAGRSATARKPHSADAGRGQGRTVNRAGQGRPAPGAVCLREDFHPGTSSPLTVDRDAGVIRRVKILGWESKNNRRYDPEAAKAAKALYEGCKVYCDHPQKADETRPTDKTLGVFRDVAWTPEGMYADLHYLKSHPMAERVCEDAERGLGVFGMSHNADGETEVQDGVTVVVRITEVRSVDLVTDPATVSNLWESRQGRNPMKKTTLRKLIEASKAKSKLSKALLEMGDELADLPVDELPAEPAAAPEGDWKADLVAAIGKLVGSEAPEDHDMAKKIMAMLKPASAEIVATEDDESDEKDDEEEVQESDESEDKDEDKKESVRRKAKAGANRLTEARAKQFCKLAGVEPEAELLEAMQAAGEETALKLVEWAKAKAAPPAPPASHGWGAKGARSQAPGTRQAVTEAKQPEAKFPATREEARKLLASAG